MQFIKNISIVGAGGQCGTYITKALLEKGRFNISALTRPDSKNTIPSGVQVKKIDYDNKESLVNALKGEDVLIITMNVMAPRDQQSKLIAAAAEANVPWVIPNEYGYLMEQAAGNDTFLGPRLEAARKQIADLGKSSYIAINCGFWFQFSLAGGVERFGFDFKNKTLTYVDDGNVQLDVSTWPQVGRAVANLLSLKVKPDGPGDTSPTLEQFRNKHVRFNSFTLSQRQMLDAVLKATGDKESDWKITHENAQERYAAGVKRMQAGDMSGFGQLLYTRMFYKDEPGATEKKHGVHNNVLQLPKEDLLEETKLAVKMAQEGGFGF